MRRLIVVMVALFAIFELQAQDIILLRSAEEIKGKVVEISSDELKYRRADMKDGPIYTIKLSSVFSVTYANGTVESFNNSVKSSDSQTSYDAYPYPNVTKSYKVGDFFDEDGIRGVVIHTTDNGRHGLILSCRESSDKMPWGYVKKNERVEVFETGARNRDDGWENMKIIADIVDNTNLSWLDFPAFNFCRNMGHGWYLPAINEIMMIFNLASERPKKQMQWQPYKEVNDALNRLSSYGVDCIQHGMKAYHNYLSSTEVDYFEVYYTSYESWIEYLDKWYYGKKKRKPNRNGEYSNKYYTGDGYCHVRAVHKF